MKARTLTILCPQGPTTAPDLSQALRKNKNVLRDKEAGPEHKQRVGGPHEKAQQSEMLLCGWSTSKGRCWGITIVKTSQGSPALGGL